MNPLATTTRLSDRPAESTRVAILGGGGLFAAATDPQTFRMLLERGDHALRPLPPHRVGRERPEDLLGSTSPDPDTVASLQAGWIDEEALDPHAAWRASGLPGTPGLDRAFVERLDPTFRLALAAATRAWADALDRAGVEARERLLGPHARIGVILGQILLPTETATRLTLRHLAAEWLKHESDRSPGLADAPSPWDAALPPVDPANLAVGGWTATLVARWLGITRPVVAFTLDAACASSLYALKLARDELLAGRADLMLCGGVSRPDALYTQMGFSRLHALSPKGRPTPFDQSGDGLIVGEGAGVFVLTRWDKSAPLGERPIRPRAILVAAGLSNDLRGGLLAPSSEGQLRAMRAAYAQAGWHPGQVDWIECHATGTPVGDAVELESLHTLWREAGEQGPPGRCPLGSVKSNVGHALTAAGAAGLLKLLDALETRRIPPTSGLRNPLPALDSRSSPFRVLTRAEPWTPRHPDQPRRAALSGFGFGGINAHLLIEEAREDSPSVSAAGSPRPRFEAPTTPARNEDPPPALAVVGLAIRTDRHPDLNAVRTALFDPSPPRLDDPKAKPPQRAYRIAPGRFRVPPRELEQALPQQILALDVATRAWEDAHGPAASDQTTRRHQDRTDHPRVGGFVGLELDPRTCDFHARWHAVLLVHACELAQGGTLDDQTRADLVWRLSQGAHPPLSPDRVMGALGGIVASRIARELRLGGPCFTLSSGSTSGLDALRVAAQAVQRGELEAAVVVAADHAQDPRAAARLAALGEADPGRHRPAAAGVALILKRFDDALKAGDPIWAVIESVGQAPPFSGQTDPNSSISSEEQRSAAPAMRFDGQGLTERLGATGAAAGLLEVARAILALHEDLLPPGVGTGPDRDRPRFWLRNRQDGPRRALVSRPGDLECHQVFLRGCEPRRRAASIQPLGPPATQWISLGANDQAGLLAALDRLESAGPIQPSTFQHIASQHVGPWRIALGLTPGRPEDHGELVAAARRVVTGQPLAGMSKWAARLVWTDPQLIAPSTDAPTQRRLAFVYPGTGAHCLGMGREIAAAWPEILRRQDSENQRLKDQYRPDLFWESRALPRPADPRDLLLAQVAHATWLTDFLIAHGARPGVALGYSLGETSALFGLRVWTDRDEMLERVETWPLFRHDLAGEQRAARRAWGLAETEPTDWIAAVLPAPLESVRQALQEAGIRRVEPLIVNTPRQTVVGGPRGEILDLARRLCLTDRTATAANSPPRRPSETNTPSGSLPPSPSPASWSEVPGVSIAHCSIVELVRDDYRAMHRLPTRTVEPTDPLFISGATGQPYRPDTESAARAIVDHATRGINFPLAVETAYRLGARLFVEVGPGSVCTRMIQEILGSRPHLGIPCQPHGVDPIEALQRTLATLHVNHALPRLDWHAAPPSDVTATPSPTSTPIVIPYDAPRPDWPDPPPCCLQPTRAAMPSSSSSPPRSFSPTKLETHPTSDSWNNAVAASLTQGGASPCFSESSSAPRPVVVGDTSSDQADEFPIRLWQGMEAAADQSARAHHAFLTFCRNLSETLAVQTKRVLDLERHDNSPAQSKPLEISSCHWVDGEPRRGGDASSGASKAKPWLDRAGCLAFAVGRISDVLGPEFAEIDAHPTRVRLPDEPLMLVDRILEIEGEPKSLTHGRIVTEHDVRPDAWYLDHGVMPTCVAIESGQADLFLSSWLGIDFRTKGEAVYRLLDAEIDFARGLPRPGETIRYDITIDHFFRQGTTYLFRFRFDGTIDGQPLCRMRNGCAGFFTREQLHSGQGLVFTSHDLARRPGVKPADWRPLAPIECVESYDAAQLDALRQGDYAAAFGPAFAGLNLTKPLSLPGGRMRTIHRVVELDPTGGRFGLGSIKAEADIHPDDWFLTCHFVDDMVMPGTLMFECCLHTLRVFLFRLGWVGEATPEVAFEPVPGVGSRLTCRGQVTRETRVVGYELTIKEIGYRPEPYAIADAVMTADGKPIVRVETMSLQLTGLDRATLERLWDRTPAVTIEARRASGSDKTARRPMYDHTSILEFAVGRPSAAFGEPYRVFDSERIIARLPGPPYNFLHRVEKVDGPPWVLTPGIEAWGAYDVDPKDWYFEAERGWPPRMPYAVLLESGLQLCGWLAAYQGSALTSPIDLSFRNLGGQAVQHRPVGSDAGTLHLWSRMTRFSQSGGMIVQWFDFAVSDERGPVLTGDTYFGFFSKAALARQVGIRESQPLSWTAAQRAEARAFARAFPRHAPFPDNRLRMIDQIEGVLPRGGSHGLGSIEGSMSIDPSSWYFQAHFHQDPVIPGSLGLESLLQLLKYLAADRWGVPASGFESMPPGTQHAWTYRGQAIPANRRVVTVGDVTAIDDHHRVLTGDGALLVDGLYIYQMKGFAVRVVD